MQALNFYVIIEKVKEAPRKVGGLEIIEAQDKDVRYLKGKVISAGENVPVIKPGDIIMYDKHAGHSIPDSSGKLYTVIKANDLVSICYED